MVPKIETSLPIVSRSSQEGKPASTRANDAAGDGVGRVDSACCRPWPLTRTRHVVAGPGRLRGELSVAISVSNAFARSGGLGSSKMRRSLAHAGENDLSYDLGLTARRVREGLSANQRGGKDMVVLWEQRRRTIYTNNARGVLGRHAQRVLRNAGVWLVLHAPV